MKKLIAIFCCVMIFNIVKANDAIPIINTVFHGINTLINLTRPTTVVTVPTTTTTYVTPGTTIINTTPVVTYQTYPQYQRPVIINNYQNCYYGKPTPPPRKPMPINRKPQKNNHRGKRR